MSEEQTPRDRVWLIIVDHLMQGDPLKTNDVVDKTGIHVRTARTVLRVAEGVGLLSRHVARAHTWCPAVGITKDLPLGESYRRAIHTLIDEAQTCSGGSS